MESEYDYQRLGRALRAARDAKGWSRPQLAQLAGVDPNTLKNLEAGRAYTRWPPSVGPIEAALGKPEGWALRMAQGAEDTPAPQATAPPASQAVAGNLPAGVRLALSEGETLGADVIYLELPVGTLKLVVVAQAAEYETNDEIAALRSQMAEWVRIQREIRDLASRKPDVASGGHNSP